MNEIKRQLLNEIKDRSQRVSEKEVKLKSSSFPIPINSNWKKNKKLSKQVEERIKNVSMKGINRGRVGRASLPTSYRFKPTDFKKTKSGLVYSGNTESGIHQYEIKKDNGNVSVSIEHKNSKKSKMKRGSLTTSKINIDFGGDMGTQDMLGSVIPSIHHHIKSVKPDTIELQTKDMKAFHDKVVKGISKNYRVSSAENENGMHSWTLQSKKITPRIQILIKSLLHK
jgi:hypothetical protein